MGCGASARIKYEASEAAEDAAGPSGLPLDRGSPDVGAADGPPPPEAEAAPPEATLEGEASAEPGEVDSDEDVADDEDVALDHAEAQAILETVDLDIQQLVTLPEWVAIMGVFGLPRSEAAHIYQDVAEEARLSGVGSGDEGVPLFEFLEELNIDSEDLEILQAVASAVAIAREKLQQAEGGESASEDEALDPRALDLVLDKVVREIDYSRRPVEDVWDVYREGKMPLSAAQHRLIGSFQERQGEFVERVKACMISPPLLNSAGGQNASRELCVAEVARIIADCKAEDKQFTDPAWDLTTAPEASLYVDKEKPGYDCTVASPAGYRRLTELIAEPRLFKGGIRQGDIIQGQIGTCFLLGAVGAIVSHNPNAIKKLFVNYDVKVGVYGVRFNLDGEWTYVVIDDWMPVDENGSLLYARSKDPEEVWCPLLEKAYCKLHTCYEMCDGGFASEAIFNFFGGISGNFKITDAHKENPVSYFQALKQARQKGYLLTTHFQPPAAATGAGQGKCGEATFDSGLVGGHCYSVLRVVEAFGHHLICCRNPWGEGEWLGKWSDKNQEGEWTDKMKEACGYLGVNDGKFWMSMQAFMENSGGVSFARSFGPNWKKVTHYKHFQHGPMLARAKFPYDAQADDEISFKKDAVLEVSSLSAGWWYGHLLGHTDAKDGFFPGNYVRLNDRPVARFDLEGTKADGFEGPMTVVVLLLQPEATRLRRFYQRREDGLNYKDTSYPRMKLVIVCPEGKVKLQKVGARRCLWGELSLPGGGQWRIYAYASDGRGSAFALRVYIKQGTAVLREVPGASISELHAAIAAG